MVCVVGVRFKKVGKIYYFDPGELPVAAGQGVIVETTRGLEYGEVCVGPRMVEDDQVVPPLKRVVRIGTSDDVRRVGENRNREQEAFGIAVDRIAAHEMDMHLVDVEYTFDGSKITFYFTAEGRVDFRDLVKDLASTFRTRIEMRQIGVRDEAKVIGGIGPCGRILCCTSFLGEFAPVSIRMAKDQNLSLNPSKISGVCGRLMCCLRYEQDTYESAKKDPTLAPGYQPPPQLEPPEVLTPDDDEEREAVASWRQGPIRIDDAQYLDRFARVLDERARDEASATHADAVEQPQRPTPAKRKRRNRRKKGTAAVGQAGQPAQVEKPPALPPQADKADRKDHPRPPQPPKAGAHPTGDQPQPEGQEGQNKRRRSRRRRRGTKTGETGLRPETPPEAQ